MVTKNFLVSFFVLSLLVSLPLQAAPHPKDRADVLKVTIHMLENGEKKSTQVVAAKDGGSASTFIVENNKKFVRNFMSPERRDGKKVLIRLHECTGDISSTELANLSAVNCRPELMSRLNVEATLNQTTIVEATGPEGQKREYFIFVEKAENPEEATTL